MRKLELQITPLRLFALALAVAVILTLIQLLEPVSLALRGNSAGYDIERLLLIYSSLPRMAVALLGGAGLAVSGVILQQVLRNPIASPETVGVSAGARLALAITSAFFPSVLGLGRDLVALFGAACSTGIVLLIARRRQYSQLSLILTGLLVSLYCGALATVLVLIKDRYLVSLFIWGSGSLSQQSWQPSLELGLRLGIAALPLALLVRPLALMELGDDTARSLGVPIQRIRVLAISLAVFYAAAVTSSVGVIGFIGLVGPAIARLSGARSFPARLLWSAVFGGLLLLVTDFAVQILAADSAAFLPTGAVTAVLGSPLLLLLLPRLKSMVPANLMVRGQYRSLIRQARNKVWFFTLLALGLCLPGLLILLGRLPGGDWYWLGWDSMQQVLPWRLPRLLCAAGAGGLLAMAGFILQRVTGNPMASPEIMGVSAGAILAVAAMLFLFPSMPPYGIYGAATGGAFIALLCVLALAVRSAFVPERILLAGIALTALVDAFIGLLTATGDPSAVKLLSWLSGSTNGASLLLGVVAIVSLILMLAVATTSTRWLTILPMGSATAKSVGVSVVLSQSLLLLLVALVTAIATPIIGPLTFIGLIAPHIVYSLGVSKARHCLPLSAFTGAVAMMLADTAARTIAFPLQLPTGIMATLIAGPFLVIIIARRGSHTDI